MDGWVDRQTDGWSVASSVSKLSPAQWVLLASTQEAVGSPWGGALMALLPLPWGLPESLHSDI
jgi:hypothetical protein